MNAMYHARRMRSTSLSRVASQLVLGVGLMEVREGCLLLARFRQKSMRRVYQHAEPTRSVVCPNVALPLTVTSHDPGGEPTEPFFL